MAGYVTSKFLKLQAGYIGTALWAARDVFIHPIESADAAQRVADHLEGLAQVLDKGEAGELAAEVLRGMRGAVLLSLQGEDGPS